MFIKKKELNLNALPKHIAFIIDGNGRWAKKRGMPRSFGHKVGMQAVKKIVTDCYDLGIKVVSIFAFSTENWKRPKKEVDYLFNLFYEYLTKNKSLFLEKNIQFRVMGDYTKLPKNLSDEIENVINLTKNNSKFILNIGINYGGQDEILRAVNLAIKDGKELLTKEDFENYLFTKNLSNPDLIIRTSGEERLSNFMLWQCAYSELYFTKTYWPSFNKKQLEKALINYQKRNRKFGAIKEE